MKRTAVFAAVLGFAMGVGLTVASGQVSDSFTACLTPGGDLKNVALGSEPANACKGNSSEVSWAADTTALEARVAALEAALDGVTRNGLDLTLPGTVAATGFFAPVVTVGVVNAIDVNTDNVFAAAVNADVLNAIDVNTDNVFAGAVSANDVNATNIVKTNTLEANVVNANDVNTRNVFATDNVFADNDVFARNNVFAGNDVTANTVTANNDVIVGGAVIVGGIQVH